MIKTGTKLKIIVIFKISKSYYTGVTGKDPFVFGELVLFFCEKKQKLFKTVFYPKQYLNLLVHNVPKWSDTL